MTDYDEAMNSYIRSKQFEKLSVNSRRIYMNGVDTLDSYFSGKALKEITRPMVIAFRDNHYSQPGKCRVAIAVLNNILQFSYNRGWVGQNVAARLGDMPPQKEIDRWQEDEIDRFLSTAPFHIKDAMMVALYTGQRRSDLVRILWSDIDEAGRLLYVKQRKTGIELWIPLHPKLHAYLEGMKKRRSVRTVFAQNHILTNHYGMPWAPDSLRAAFKRHSAKIGLRDKMLHGVRKTTASILGEIGCTALQIMAITGHQSLKEVQRYTQGAEKKRLAEEAMAKWQ
jgi:integrase